MTVHHFGTDERMQLKWYHHMSDFANILKAFVGTNYLSLAYGFQQAGIGLGIVGLVLVAVLTDHCCQLLIKVKYLVVDQFSDQYMFPSRRKHSSTSSAGSIHDDQVEEFAALLRHRMQKNLTYPDLGRIIYGRSGAAMVNTFLLITQFGFCMNYYIFMGNILYSFLPVKMPMSSSPMESGFGGFNGTSPGAMITGTHHGDIGRRSILDNITVIPTVLNIAVEELGSVPNITDTVLELNKHKNTSNTVAPQDIESLSTTVTNMLSTAIQSIVSTTAETTTDANMNSTYGLTTVSPTEAASEDNSSEAYQHPHQASKIQRKGPSLALMVLLPAPLCIAFTLFRDVRRMGPISAVANLSVICGSLAVLVYILSDFSVAEDVVWFKLATFSVFLGQVTASYEGIGTIMSIEGSMDGNRHCFGGCLRGAIITFTVTLFFMAVVGYLKFGEATEQILVQNLPLGDAVTVLVNITLLIGVLCTYPLQVFPVVDIVEGFIFAEGGCCGPAIDGTMDSDSDTDDVFDAEDASKSLIQTAEADINKVLPVAKAIPKSIPTWKRNLLRVFIALFIAGVSVLMRNVFAYVGAFVGAVGSCPLAFILPALFHYKLARHSTSPYTILKDMLIIVIGAVTGVIGFIVVTTEIFHRL